MPSDGERYFCNLYNVHPRRIRSRQILQILQTAIEIFDFVKLQNMETFNCNYSLLAECPETDPIDDEYPFIGTGWEIKDVVLSLASSEQAVCDPEFYTEVRHILLTKFEKAIEFMKGTL